MQSFVHNRVGWVAITSVDTFALKPIIHQYVLTIQLGCGDRSADGYALSILSLKRQLAALSHLEVLSSRYKCVIPLEALSPVVRGHWGQSAVPLHKPTIHRRCFWAPNILRNYDGGEAGESMLEEAN